MRLPALMALALLLPFGASATDPVTGETGATGSGAAPAGGTGNGLKEKKLLLLFGGPVAQVGEEVARDRERYRNPAELQKLVDSKFTEADRLEPEYQEFQKMFVNQVLVSIGPPPPASKPKIEVPINATNPPEGAVAVRPAPAGYGEQYMRNINQPWVPEQVGKRALERNDFAQAFQDYSKALELGDTRPEVYLGYGVSALQLKDYALAAQTAKILLSANPKDKDALTLYHASAGRAPAVNLPSVLGGGGSGANLATGGPPAGAALPAGFAAGGFGGSGRTAEQVAAAARAQAAAAGPDAVQRSALITKDVQSALYVKDYPTAHNLASQAITLNNANVQALNFRAIASNKMHRYNDAVTDASAALALAPGNGAVLQTRSWAFAKQGLFQEALKDAEDTLSRNPSDPYAYQNKAMALAGMKDRAGALEALARSAALDPRFKNRYERALQLPQDQDLSLLFDDETAASAAAAAAAQPPRTGKRFARLALLSGMGGILIALGILHVVSASWREKVNMTIRRVLASSDAAGTDASVAVATPLPSSPGGAFWLQYELVKEIGLGGMGVVYEAKDRSLERRVAVKKMRDEIRIDPHERRRFVNEAKLVAQLHHPNIVDIYAIVEEGQEVYLVFEYVTGRTLHDLIKAEGPMSLEAARGVLAATAGAVEHAHAAQIVHRDL
ncbi:MAG: protein kinase [Elusimicrobia bacterium]|nr:protein kinase [Elusimicrobiota bacterium]